MFKDADFGFFGLKLVFWHANRDQTKYSINNAMTRSRANFLVDFVSFDLPPNCILNQIMLDTLGTGWQCRNSLVSCNLFQLTKNKWSNEKMD